MPCTDHRERSTEMGMRAARTVAVLLAIIVIGLGCSRGDGVLRWTEDVTLTDGRIVTLHREQCFDGGTAEDGSAMSGRMTIRLAHPDTGNPIIWDSPYALTTQALVLNRGTVYLLIAPGVGTTVEAAGCPFPLTMVFRHTDSGWVQMPLEAMPVARVAANMVLDAKASLVSIRGANYHLDAAATSGAAGWASRDYPIAELHNGERQQFRCPEKRKLLTK